MEEAVATQMWVASYIQTKQLMIEVYESKLVAHQKSVTAQIEAMQNHVNNAVKQLEMKLSKVTGLPESDTRLQEDVEDLPRKVLESSEELVDGWEAVWSSTQKKYYYWNRATDTNQWEVPRRAAAIEQDPIKLAKKDYQPLKDAILQTLSSDRMGRVTRETIPVTNPPIETKTMAVAKLLERLKKDCEGQPVAEDLCLLVDFFGWHPDGYVDVNLLSEVCKGTGHLHLFGMPNIDEAMRIEEQPKNCDWIPTKWSCLNGMAQLDSKLYQVFSKNCIRLLNAEVLRRPEGLLDKILTRQDIELLIEKERLPQKVYMSKEDVLKILSEGMRGIGVLSYGWRGDGYCDPHGDVFSSVVRCLNQDQLKHVQAVFWDCPCLYQWPRDPQQEEMFQEGLKVMGDLYASSLCTTVMRHKHIPKDPTEDLRGRVVFSGVDVISYTEKELIREVAAVCHEFFDMEWDERESAEKELEFTNNKRLIVECPQGHDFAEKAVKEMKGRLELRGLKANLVYNSVDYDKRGWPTFESAVSEEIISRAMHYKHMCPLLQRLPAKMVDIDRDPPKEVEIEPMQESVLKPIVRHRTFAIESPYSRTRHWESRIRDSYFTNSSDKDVVCNLYRTYVKNVHLAAKMDTKPLSFYVGDRNCQGLPHGCGWKLDTEGNVYSGTFHNGKRDGSGITRFSNGEIHEGSWKSDERSGTGRMWGSLPASTTGKIKIFQNEYYKNLRVRGDVLREYEPARP